MPNYRGHLLGGAIAYGLSLAVPLRFTYFPCAGVLSIAGEFLACLIGSLAPDIDIHSKGRQILNKIIFVGLVLSSFQKSTAALLIFIGVFLFAQNVGHRQMTHHPAFIIIVPYCLGVVLNQHITFLPEVSLNLYCSFVLGALSHILLDNIPKRYLPSIFAAADEGAFNLSRIKRRVEAILGKRWKK